MTWNPWSRCRELAVDVAMLQARCGELECRLDEMRDEKKYWQSKAEILLDNALLRKGETVAQVMSPTPTPSVEQTMGSVFGPLAVTEIESGKRRPSRGDAASIR